MKNDAMTSLRGTAPGPSSVGTNKQEIRLNPYAGGHIADLSFLYAALPQYAAAPSKPARERLGANLAKNTTDWQEVLDFCSKVYEAKKKTSLARFEEEADFLTEIETVKRYFTAACGL